MKYLTCMIVIVFITQTVTNNTFKKFKLLKEITQNKKLIRVRHVTRRFLLGGPIILGLCIVFYNFLLMDNLWGFPSQTPFGRYVL